MEVNDSAGCSRLLGALFSTSCSTLFAGSLTSPREGRKNARMAMDGRAHLHGADELNGYGADADEWNLPNKFVCGTYKYVCIYTSEKTIHVEHINTYLYIYIYIYIYVFMLYSMRLIRKAN